MTLNIIERLLTQYIILKRIITTIHNELFLGTMSISLGGLAIPVCAKKNEMDNTLPKSIVLLSLMSDKVHPILKIMKKILVRNPFA